MTNSQDELHTKLNHETAVIKWAELQRHFARGDVLVVDSSLDLIDAAMSITRDETDLLLSGQIKRAEDEHARSWLQRDPTLWALVVAPWILVQEAQQDNS